MLTNKTVINASVNCHCPAEDAIPGPSSRTRTPSGSMLEDVNPLMFFSPDEKNNMANEVEQILSDESDDDGMWMFVNRHTVFLTRIIV